VRLAVISDVHGNALALEAVLSAIAAEEPDLVINLGDMLSGGFQAKQVADRIRSSGQLVIRGNHDRGIAEGPERSSDILAAAQLADDHIAWLATLPARAEPAPGVVCFHGTPGRDLDYLLETVTDTGVRAATTAEIAERLGADTAAELVLCGHSHRPRAVRVPGGPLVVNPGSVGLPAIDSRHPVPHVIESGSPHARYAIVERGPAGWDARLCQAEYDFQAAARIAEDCGRPDLAYILRTGRVATPLAEK